VIKSVKDGLTNIDVYVLSRELQGKRFSKIVRVPGGYKIKISGGQDLLVLPGRFIIPTSYVIEAGRPDNLSILSRKRLGNARIESFEQINFDRILRIRTDRGSIIIESFGDGNIILTDENDTIIYALRERDWRDRSVRRGVMYTPPPPPRISPTTALDTFVGIFTAKDAVRSLVRAGIPPIYAEELCFRAGVDKNTPVSELSDAQKELLFNAFRELIDSLNDPEPVVVRDGEEIVDITPVPLLRYKDYDLEHFDSFSAALDVLTPKLFEISSQPQEKKEKSSVVEFWKKQLEEAKQELSELEQMIEKAYEHSYELEQAIASARAGKPLESVGPFKLKGYDGRELVYEFTPRL